MEEQRDCFIEGIKIKQIDSRDPTQSWLSAEMEQELVARGIPVVRLEAGIIIGKIPEAMLRVPFSDESEGRGGCAADD